MCPFTSAYKHLKKIHTEYVSKKTVKSDSLSIILLIKNKMIAN